MLVMLLDTRKHHTGVVTVAVEAMCGSENDPGPDDQKLFPSGGIQWKSALAAANKDSTEAIGRKSVT